MKARFLASIAVGILALGLTLRTYVQGSPASPAGQIKAVRVVGDVQLLRGPGNPAVALHDNDAVVQGDVVITAKASSVVLVFSNGSTVNLAQDSRLAIDQFLQDPFRSGKPHRHVDVTVADIMTPVGEIRPLRLGWVAGATTADVAALFGSRPDTHLLVAEDEPGGGVVLRGIFSRTRLERQLDGR